RLRERAVPKPNGVEEIRCAKGERCDCGLNERAPLRFAPREDVIGAAAQQQPGRNCRERKSEKLKSRQRLAEERRGKQDRDDKIHAEYRRIRADHAGREASDKVIEAEKNEEPGKQTP